ncbi:hypothetical protein AB0K35_15660 [Micromonospora sp. NPDC053740]|uniref:hypothetical protein n=1 Tax=Micromonospora sp. NPDC053740 TaxID=3155173 RepID=UPI003424E213
MRVHQYVYFSMRSRDLPSTLQVVRYFNDDDGDQQHRLGWHLDRRSLEFLRHTGAELDVDEYGDD